MTADLAWWGAAAGAAGGIVLIVVGLAGLPSGDGAAATLIGVVAVAASTYAVVVAGQIAEAPDAAPAAAAICVGVTLAILGVVAWRTPAGDPTGPGIDPATIVTPLLVGAGAATAVAGWRARDQ